MLNVICLQGDVILNSILGNGISVICLLFEESERNSDIIVEVVWTSFHEGEDDRGYRQ